MWIHLLTLGLIDGAGGEPVPPSAQVGGGFWENEYRKMLEWAYKKKPELEQIIEELPEEIEVETEQIIVNAIEKTYPNIDISKIYANLDMQAAILQMIQSAIEKARKESIEEYNRAYLLLM